MKTFLHLKIRCNFLDKKELTNIDLIFPCMYEINLFLFL